MTEGIRNSLIFEGSFRQIVMAALRRPPGRTPFETAGDGD
jgi:hypothetical protein